MLKMFTAAALSLLITGQAMANDPEGEEANKQLIICLYRGAMQLDDGVSDVNSLAPAVADSCQTEEETFYQALRGTINGPINEQQARNATHQRTMQMAGRVVLMKRADDRKRK